MKHLFLIAAAGGIFSATTMSLKAQTIVNIETLAARNLPKNSLKFIEGIEIEMVPADTAGMIVVTNEIVTSNQLNVEMPLNSKTGFISRIELCAPLQFKYAMLMDREVESITNFSLYHFIDAWWATPYRYGGTSSSGIDCSAFTGKLFSEVYGLTIPRTANDQFKICEKMATADLVEGDLVFFNTRGGVSHVGLYLGHNYFVHCSVSGGVTISSLTDEYYSRKFISGGRIPPSPDGVYANSQASAREF